jgi:hypothetical protein
MEIKRSGSQASSKGPAEWFTTAPDVEPRISISMGNIPKPPGPPPGPPPARSHRHHRQEGF